MTTIEVQVTKEQRKALKSRTVYLNARYAIENLSDGYINVICQDEGVDDLTDLLDSWNLQWRLV